MVPTRASITSKRPAFSRTNLAARWGNKRSRNAASAGDDTDSGKASVRQNFSTTWPALRHSSVSSIQTRAAPRRGSQGTFTMARMRSGWSITGRFSNEKACPKFMPHRVHVMADGDRWIGVTVREDELVVELQHVFARIERGGAVRVHREVRQRLVREESRFPL